MRKKCNKEDCKCGKKVLDYFLNSSDKTFPDGANYRIEVSGVEDTYILEVIIKEAKKLGIPIHRAIATVKGSSYYTDKQLMALALLAAKEKIEVIICPWKLAALVFENPNRIFSDLRLSDHENGRYLQEIDRCVKLGFRGFLVWDKDMLELLDFKRKQGGLPKETIFKLSTFANSVNIINFDSAVKKGADTINVANGLSLKELESARLVVPKEVKLDVHITFWQQTIVKNLCTVPHLATAPYDRIDDAPEIARICSPVYFKFEAGTPGITVYDVPRNGWTFKDLAEHKKKDVQTAAAIVKYIKYHYSYLNLKTSNWGPSDLRVPIVELSPKEINKNTQIVIDLGVKAQRIAERKRRK